MSRHSLVKYFFLMVYVICFSNSLFAADSIIHSVPVCTLQRPAVSVSAQQGIFQVSLPSTPGTGYSWFMRSDTHALIPVSHMYQASFRRELVGAPGVEIWTFHVKEVKVPQQFLLEFVYARSFEFSVQPKKFICQVSVFPAAASA